jgi:5-methyltetrahydrofolate corrinoid/iron sulfur protein methyltransferase
MILIAESIHVISKDVNTAIMERNPKVIRDLAAAQAEAQADYIDLNVGPARKDPEELMQWLVQTVQEVVDLPLSIDTMNPVAMEAGLKACKERPLLNSASNKTESKELMLPLAKKYDCDVVISVIADYGMPPGVDERVSSILEVVEYADSLGIENEQIWVDPIILPISTAGEGQRHAAADMEFIEILPELLPDVKSTVGLSNVSNGAPNEFRPILNQTFAVMLQRKGLYSAIVDVLDKDFVPLVRGKRPEITALIHRVMDGEEVDQSGLSKEEQQYVKTAEVLMGKSLYSDAWLEG